MNDIHAILFLLRHPRQRCMSVTDIPMCTSIAQTHLIIGHHPVAISVCMVTSIMLKPVIAYSRPYRRIRPHSWWNRRRSAQTTEYRWCIAPNVRLHIIYSNQQRNKPVSVRRNMRRRARGCTRGKWRKWHLRRGDCKRKHTLESHSMSRECRATSINPAIKGWCVFLNMVQSIRWVFWWA